MATVEELVNDLKGKAHILREMEAKLTAMLQEALKTGKRAAEWSETDASVVRLRKECTRLRTRIMRRIEAKTKRRGKNSGLNHTLPGPAPSLAPPLFPQKKGGE